MKRNLSLLFFFISFSFYAQNDTLSIGTKPTISEVFVKTNNVIYVGIKNRIYINVPYPETLTASSPGLTIEDNKFYIFPNISSEQTLFLSFKTKEGTFVTEKHVFKVKSIPVLLSMINGNNCSKCVVEMKKNELKDALISLKFDDVALDIDFKVTSYSIYFEGNKQLNITVQGDRISDEVFERINKLNVGSHIFITEIRFSYSFNEMTICKVTPIKIVLIE